MATECSTTAVPRSAEARPSLFAARGRRVMLMLLTVWVLSWFDLEFTVLAEQIGGFEEANPIARPYTGNRAALTAYKLVLVLPASGGLLLCRRRRLAELACVGLCAVHGCLAGLWTFYYTVMHTHWEVATRYH